MSMTTEFEIKVSDGRIIDAHTRVENGICKLTIETEKTIRKAKDTFVLVEASKLSLKDTFLKYELKGAGGQRAAELKQELIRMIDRGIKDFWRPRMDPSFDSERIGIRFVEDREPAVGKNYNWWDKAAKDFCPERNSRLGTRAEYVAFLGVLIKKLVESGYYWDEAWWAVCQDSKMLGHYADSKNARGKFEVTGSREVCGFCDLGNTNKILAFDKKEGTFWRAGGSYEFPGGLCPLAYLRTLTWENRTTENLLADELDDFVGWIVLDDYS